MGYFQQKRKNIGSKLVMGSRRIFGLPWKQIQTGGGVAIFILFFLLFFVVDCRRGTYVLKNNVHIGFGNTDNSSVFLSAEHRDTHFPFQLDDIYKSTWYNFIPVLKEVFGRGYRPYDRSVMNLVAYRITISGGEGGDEPMSQNSNRIGFSNGRSFIYNSVDKLDFFAVNFPEEGYYTIKLEAFFVSSPSFSSNVVSNDFNINERSDRRLAITELRVRVVPHPEVAPKADIPRFFTYSETNPDKNKGIIPNGQVESLTWGTKPYRFTIYTRDKITQDHLYSDFDIYMVIQGYDNVDGLKGLTAQERNDILDENINNGRSEGVDNIVLKSDQTPKGMESKISGGSVPRGTMKIIHFNNDGKKITTILSDSVEDCSFDMQSEKVFLENTGFYDIQYVAKRKTDGREFRSRVYSFQVIDDRLNFEITNVNVSNDTFVDLRSFPEFNKEGYVSKKSDVREGESISVLGKVSDWSDHKVPNLRFLRSNSIGVYSRQDELDPVETGKMYPDMKMYKVSMSDNSLNPTTAKDYVISYNIEYENVANGGSSLLALDSKTVSASEKSDFIRVWLPVLDERDNSIRYKKIEPGKSYKFLRTSNLISDRQNVYVYVSSLLYSENDKRVNGRSINLTRVPKVTITVGNTKTHYAVTKSVGAIMRVRTPLELDGKWNKVELLFSDRVNVSGGGNSKNNPEKAVYAVGYRLTIRKPGSAVHTNSSGQAYQGIAYVEGVSGSTYLFNDRGGLEVYKKLYSPYQAVNFDIQHGERKMGGLGSNQNEQYEWVYFSKLDPAGNCVRVGSAYWNAVDYVVRSVSLKLYNFLNNSISYRSLDFSNIGKFVLRTLVNDRDEDRAVSRDFLKQMHPEYVDGDYIFKNTTMHALRFDAATASLAEGSSRVSRFSFRSRNGCGKFLRAWIDSWGGNMVHSKEVSKNDIGQIFDLPSEYKSGNWETSNFKNAILNSANAIVGDKDGNVADFFRNEIPSNFDNDYHFYKVGK